MLVLKFVINLREAFTVAMFFSSLVWVGGCRFFFFFGSTINHQSCQNTSGDDVSNVRVIRIREMLELHPIYTRIVFTLRIIFTLEVSTISHVKTLVPMMQALLSVERVLL